MIWFQKIFQDYDAIIAGVRVYNTNKLMVHIQSKLLNYVSNGGNYLVQYTVNRGYSGSEVLVHTRINISTDRVTDEEAKD